MNRWSILRSLSPLAAPLSTGLLCSLFVLAAVTPFRMTFGFHSLTDVALLVAMLSAWLASEHLRTQAQKPSAPHLIDLFASTRWLRRQPWLLGGVCGLFAPLLVSACAWGLHWTSTASLTNPYFAAAFLCGCALMTIAPAACAGMCSFQTDAPTPVKRCAWLLGTALGWLVLPTHILPWMTLPMLVALGLLLVGVIRLVESGVLLSWRKKQPGEAVQAISITPLSVSIPSLPVVGTPHQAPVSPAIIGLGALAGAGLALAVFVTSQLLLPSLALHSAAWFALLLGVACFAPFPNVIRKIALRPTHRGPFIVALLLAGWVACLAAGFEWLTWFSLQLTVYASSISWLLTGRIALLSALLLPGTLCIGWLTWRAAPTTISRNSWLVPCAAAVGYFAVSWSSLLPVTLAVALAGTGLIMACDRWLRARWTITPTNWSRAAAGVCGLFVAVGMSLSGNLRTELSERVLYSPQVFAAMRNRVPTPQLPVLDDGRLMAEFETVQGRISLWRHRGSQLVTRRNGIPVEFHSTNPELAPRSVGDILPTLLPLVLHSDARHVLVLGAHVSSLETCYVSPLESVTVWEGNPAAIQALEWRRTLADSPLSLENGPVISIEKVHSPLIVHGRQEQKFDIITLPQAPPAEIATGSGTQLEFYRRLQGSLAEGGIVAQRIDYYDLGPDVVRGILATLQASFEHILLVESLPGELVCLGSARELLVDEATMNRLRAPQYRLLLGEAGWDWALVLGRGGLTEDAVEKFVNGARPATTQDSRLAWRLPVEVARWEGKADRTRAALSAYGNSLWTLLGADSPLAKEVTERIEDQALAYRIQTDHPDDPWAYRAALKTRLQDRPRTILESVKSEGLRRVLHPDDRRRKNYLEALGDVAQQPHPAPEEVVRLVSYEEPFDPLVSQFIGYEAATLLSRAEEADAPQRLRQLLHTAYFGPGTDRSVRNIAASIEILCDESLPISPDQRYDHLNGLLHLMTQRWQSRWAEKEPGKYAAQDSAHCVAAVDLALGNMAKLHKQAGLSGDEWTARESMLRQSLVFPLERQRSVSARPAPAASPAK